MGNEAKCVVRLGKQRSRGKALLETAEVIFRAEDGALRLKIPFSTITSVFAEDGELRMEIPEGLATFELGANAAKWREKILHPKTRMEKLGVKSGDAVAVAGDFDSGFVGELNAAAGRGNTGKISGALDWIFLAVNSSTELSQIAKMAKNLKGPAALWVVYPKGQKGITENDVLAAGRKAGLKDIKVVGFSGTHTALKFVIPVGRR
jgi:hypothetical protein